MLKSCCRVEHLLFDEDRQLLHRIKKRKISHYEHTMKKSIFLERHHARMRGLE